MTKVSGTIKKSDLEGGHWLLVTGDGAQYQLEGAKGIKDGEHVVVEGKVVRLEPPAGYLDVHPVPILVAANGPKGVAAPPPCATCHSPGSLPSLHRVGGAGRDGGVSLGPNGNAGHGSCSTCHSAHDPAKAARADRATCTSCHTNKKDHQPEAKVCNGCHVFRK